MLAHCLQLELFWKVLYLWILVQRVSRLVSVISDLRHPPLDSWVHVGSSYTPDKGPSSFPSMPQIEISTPGVKKLLDNLKPHKASGPDSFDTSDGLKGT